MTQAQKYTREMAELHEKSETTIEALKKINDKYPFQSINDQVATFSDGSQAKWYDEHNRWRTLSTSAS